jgi:hypothetical protein
LLATRPFSITTEIPMTKRTYAEPEAEKLLPLLVSIGREVKNRMRAITELEQKLAASRASKGSRDPAARETIAQLAMHKRELRTSLEELERLGCDLDADHPLRILIPGLNGPMAFEGSLEKTQFRFRPGMLEP